MAEQKKKNRVAFGCLFWIACILLIIAAFFLKRNTINDVLKKTGFFETVFNNTTEIDNSVPEDEDFVPITAPPEQVEPPPTVTPPTDERPITVVTDAPPAEPQTPPQEVPPETAPPVRPSGETAVQPSPPPTADRQTTAKPAPVKTRDAKLYFIQIDRDGQVVRRAATRKIPVSDTPLMDTLQTLFNGPDTDESGKGLITLIPSGTRLISAAVKNGVATINISEDFRFSHYGAEGLIGQLIQVVYTATEFPTVTSVQILIEGQRKEYLSGDGIWIGTPLSRESF